MAKRAIKVGEQVIGRILGACGRYGTRQVIGKLVGGDKKGNRLVVVHDRLWLSGKPVEDLYLCYGIRRV